MPRFRRWRSGDDSRILAVVQSIPDSTRRAATAMMATEVVRDVALHLHGSSVDVMPIKGALFQHILYADPSERALTDVDMIVRPVHLDRAIQTLSSHGYHRTGDNGLFAVTLQTPFALTLDLHGGLFDRARYRYRVDDVFARARRDTELFGAPVLVPSPEDIYAQLVGKCVSDHVDERSPGRLAEVALAGEVLSLDAARIADHLVAVGMGRAARYALPAVASATGDAFAADVMRSLPPDPVGSALAEMCSKVIATTPTGSRPGAIAAHLLNESVARGLWSGARSMLRRPHAG